jgi:Carbohydrate family 9 binding domain-like
MTCLSHKKSVLIVGVASASLFVACGLSLQGVTPSSLDASTFKDGRSPMPDAPDAMALDGAVDAPREAATATPMLSEDPGPPDCAGTSVSPYVAMQWNQAIVADGKASDWPASVKWNKLSIQRNATAALCADFAVVWSPSALHVMVRVKDSMHETTSNPDDLWHNDSTEVFFGPPNAISGAFRPTDVQWLVDHAGRSRALVGGLAADTDGDASYVAGAHEFPSGFVTEYAISKDRVGATSVGLSVGAMIPFSVAAGDGPGQKFDQTRYASWVMPRTSIVCNRPSGNVQYCCDGDELGPFCNTLQWGVLTLQ